MVLWIKTTMDKYEYIVAIGDTAKELADKVGVSVNTINGAISHSKKLGVRCCYKKVRIDDDKEDKK